MASIGKETFNGCRELIKIIIKREKPSILGEDAFENCGSQLQISVPLSSIEEYKNDNKWKLYIDRLISE